jgi:hypothetical protein
MPLSRLGFDQAKDEGNSGFASEFELNQILSGILAQPHHEKVTERDNDGFVTEEKIWETDSESSDELMCVLTRTRDSGKFVSTIQYDFYDDDDNGGRVLKVSALETWNRNPNKSVISKTVTIL